MFVDDFSSTFEAFHSLTVSDSGDGYDQIPFSATRGRLLQCTFIPHSLICGMNCPTCNNETEPGTQFCDICGTELSSGEVVTGPEQPMVSFAEAISRGLSNYFKFSGRATMAEHSWWPLFIFLVGLISFLGEIFGLVLLIPGFSLGARRLLEINKSGWWQLLWFAILIGWIILIIWWVRQGGKGPNGYVPDPRTTPRS